MRIRLMKNDITGITLIALIVTIVVLIILAGVAINLTISNNGILKKAIFAREENKKSQILEELNIKIMDIQVKKQGSATFQDVIDELQADLENEYILATELATITGTIPDVTNKSELYVKYKDYWFKIDRQLNVYLIEKYEEENTNNEDFILYDANGGENAPNNQKKSNLIISEIIPIRENYIFVGWGTNKDTLKIEYKLGEKYTGNVQITLYAIWYEKISYLESNGTQYIDTGYYPNQDTSIEFVAESLIEENSA